jgi:hypothetical protein
VTGPTAIARVEELLAEAEQLADPRARELARALAAALVDVVGAGLARVTELAGEQLAATLAHDELVGALLVLCDMHPDAPAVRIERGLAGAHADLAATGVALAAVETIDRGVRVRTTTVAGTAIHAAQARSLVETIAIARAPDIDTLVVELDGKAIMANDLVPADRLRVVT